MVFRTIGIVCMLVAVSSSAFAEESFESLAGFRLGQECSDTRFAKQKSQVRNPDDSLDKIEVLRGEHKSIAVGGYSLYVACSIIDNKVHHISLTSSNHEAISNIQSSLREKMGRPADTKDSSHSKAQRFLGVTMDGRKMEEEYWNLSGNRKASAFTMITQPFGSKSLSDLKWLGGIELAYPGANDLEWRHLKDRGATSSNEKKALNEKQQRETIKGLLK